MPIERADYRWLIGFVRPYGAGLAAVLLLSFAASGLALVQPYLTKLLIDDGLIPRDFDSILFYCLILVGIAALAFGSGLWNRWLYVGISGRILFAMREAVYGHLQTLSPDFFARRPLGDLMNRLDGDIAEIQRFSTDFILGLVNGVFALVGSVAIMLWLNWKLALLAFVLLPLQVGFLRYMRPRVESETRTVRERAGRLSGFLIERLSQMRLVQSSGEEERETESLKALNREYLADIRRLQITNYVTAGVPNFLTGVSVAFVFLLGGMLLIEEIVTLGTLIAFSQYLARASGPVQTLLGLYVATQRAGVSLARVRELTAVEPAVHDDREKYTELPGDWRGHVVFHDVSFRYPAGEGPVLDHFDVDAPAGKKVALAGPTGIGKSTVIDLLMRFYDPQSGRITLDGVDLREIPLSVLRRQIALVGQDVMLFNASVRDNVAYGAGETGDEAVWHVLGRVRMSDRIRDLPDGLDTLVGERGATLSGGERQRLTIARALLRDPAVLILDEATSALDHETEDAILGDIDRLFEGRTRLIVSHRDRPLQGAHAIYRLEDGRAIPSRT